MKHALTNFPFPPKRWPFFYGWFILAACALGTLASVPGQTMGVAAFTEPLIHALAIGRTRVSLAYMIGTVGSAFLLTWAGRMYDRWGARITGCAAAALLGGTLFYLSAVDRITGSVTNLVSPTLRPWTAFAVLAFGFLVLRFSGQGVLTMVSRNMLMKWFDHKRGFVNGIMAVVIPVGFSSAPLVFHRLIGHFGWRGTWFLLGMVLLLGICGFVAVFYRDNPEDCSLEPDGGIPADEGDPKHDPPRDFTLAEACRTATFWVYNLTIALNALYITAFTFHVESIFAEAGLTVEKAYAVFIPASMLAVVIGFLSGWISDHIRLKTFLYILIAGMSISMIGVLTLAYPTGFPLIILGNGISGGVFGLLMTVTWPRFFGRRHLGAISGFQMSWSVGFSAVGPFMFGISLAALTSYDGAVVACLAVLALLLVQALRIPPRPNAHP